MLVLELGNYVAPAFAGMLLAEQGHDVVKWHTNTDPILRLYRGDELWQWINHRKHLTTERSLDQLVPTFERLPEYTPHIIIDNFRAETLARYNIDPAALAERFTISWVSLRSEIGDTSFDVLAQARSWMEYAPWMPFYLGDTTAGLMLAFKALSMHALDRHEHAILGHATILQKMVEGELVVDIERDGKSIPWDIDEYTFRDGAARVTYKSREYVEPIRDRAWKWEHLWHDNGRMRI